MASRNAAVVASLQRVPARRTRSEPSNLDIWSPHIGCAMSTTSYFSSAIGEHRFSFQQLLDSALDHEFLDLVAPSYLESSPSSYRWPPCPRCRRSSRTPSLVVGTLISAFGNATHSVCGPMLGPCRRWRWATT